jgi:predicted nucleic acid-binding protein
VSKKWVINSSPLICLGKISQIHLLEELCSELIIPMGVFQEVQQGIANDPAKNWLEGDGSKWLKDIGAGHPEILAWDLGLGESQVLSWAYQNRDYEIVVDDRMAIRCASALNIPSWRTLGVVMLVKKKKLLPAVKPIIEQLIQVGLYLSPAVVQKALILAEEND